MLSKKILKKKILILHSIKGWLNRLMERSFFALILDVYTSHVYRSISMKIKRNMAYI